MPHAGLTFRARSSSSSKAKTPLLLEAAGLLSTLVDIFVRPPKNYFLVATPFLTASTS